MSSRTIMIFPEFKNIDRIHAIRGKYDPLANLVAPHITLVFPFDSPLTNGELGAHIKECLTDIQPFSLALNGFEKHADEYGYYLFINLIRGMEIVKEIHDRLYRAALRRFDSGRAYVPHMTVGKLPSMAMLDEALEDVGRRDERFDTVVKRISVEMIGDRDESIVVMEHALG